MPQPKKRRERKHRTKQSQASAKKRALQFQTLESRRLLAGDVPLADITGLWVTVGGREYFTSEQAAVTIDMVAGETLQVTGVRYGLDDTATANDGVVAFESYVRREHGASTIGSYDYTDGRFASPLQEDLAGGAILTHPGFESGWQLDVIDNRVAVVAIRYFEDSFVVEDRLLVDVNVTVPVSQETWGTAINAISSVSETASPENYLEGEGLTVIKTGTAPGDRFEVGVKAKAITENAWANGFVVVDYQSENNFVYAGLRAESDQWVIGQYDGAFHDLATIEQSIDPQQLYDLRVAVDGSRVALASDGIFHVSHDFERPLDQGTIGLANEYALTHFTDFRLFKNNASDDSSTTDHDASIAAAQHSLEAARIAAEQAQQASEAGATAAEQAAQAKQEAMLAANAAADAHDAASGAVIDATAAYDNTVDLVSAAEENAQLAADAIVQAETSLAPLNDLALDAQVALDQTQQIVEQAATDHQSYRDAVDEAAAASDVAEQQLADAEAASVTAESIAAAAQQEADLSEEVADALPKKERKAAKKIADQLQDIADDAKDDAKDAARAAKDARIAAEDAADVLADAVDDAAPTQSVLDEAIASRDEAQANLDAALDAVDAALHNVQVARDAAAEADATLQAALATSNDAAREVDLAVIAVTDAAVRVSQSNEAVNIATSLADNANATAARLAHEAALAAQAVGAAALAVEQATEAADATTNQPHVSTAPVVEQSANAYALNFNHQDIGAFETVLGEAELVAGQLHLVPASDALAVSVMDSAALPERATTRVYTTVRADVVPGYQQNGFIVFDYQSPDDFKYAGAWAGEDRWAIGEVVDGQLVDTVTLDEVIGEGPAYELQIWIEGDQLTFLVEGQQKLQHTYAQPVDTGRIGVASQNARSRFDQVAVMPLHDGAGDVGIENTDPVSATDAAIAELF